MGDIKLCGWCNNHLKNQKVYCSRECQYKGNSRNAVRTAKIKKECLFCKEEYEFQPNWKQHKNTKYCSRSCKDSHQCILYLGENNPTFGKIQSEQSKLKRKIAIDIFWSNPENKIKNIERLKLVVQRLGHWPGTDEHSRNLIKQTCLEKYGVEHPWMNPAIRQKCEETSINLYGKNTWEIAKSARKKINTKIELKLSSSLSDLSLNFLHPYVLNDRVLRREFDFFVPELNVLIEADGDYWHANPIKYDQNCLNCTQIQTKNNDEIKNAMAYSAKIHLLRFWETDIKKDNFVQVLSEALWAKR